MAYEKLKDENYQNTGGINEKASEYITGPNQFLDLRNFGFARPGALQSRPGYAEYASFANTTLLTSPTSVYQYVYSNGNSYIVFDSGNKLYYLVGSGATVIGESLTANATTAALLDFEIQNNHLFFANGGMFGRTQELGFLTAPPSYIKFGILDASQGWQGNAASKFATFADPGIFGSDFTATFAAESGTYFFSYFFSKSDEVFGLDNNSTTLSSQVLSVFLSATTIIHGWYVSGINLTGTTTLPLSSYGINFAVLKIKRPGSSEFISAPSSVDVTSGQIAVPDFRVNTEYDQTPWFTLVPQYLESYKNMLFAAGFSSQPSTVWHSELANYENIQPENFIEIRTDNGDVITNLTAYQDTLIVFKRNSIHEINGDSPETINLKNVTFEYGCVNNRAAVSFTNKLWFCDEKGICEYNGPDTFIVSYPVEQMLAAEDKSKCRAFYVKSRSEVWFNFGQRSYVYDHDVGAWTIYDNLQIENSKASALIQVGSTQPAVNFIVQGASFVSFKRFDDALTTDDGAAITLVAQTRFHKRLGDSTQEMWRRLYMDTDTAGATAAANFKQDYGTSTVLSRNLTMGVFQTRIDYGISAKSLSVEFVLQSTNRVTFNGYTLESRFLRSV